MSRALAAALAALAALLLGAAPAAAALIEPVSVTATAPAYAGANTPFPLQVDVAAEPGALDIAAQPLRLRVRLAPECGGSFAGTEGQTAIDRVLPAPLAGTAYAASVSTSVKLGPLGQETVCAFLEDAQERQFATDTEETVAVIRGCGPARRTLTKLRHRFAHLNHRIAQVRRQRRHAPSAAKRRALGKRLQRLRKKRHAVKVRNRRAAHLASLACGSGGGG